MPAKRPRPSPNAPTPLLSVTACDALAVSLRRIETLAALLCALSDHVPCEPVDGVLVGETAGMISDEAIRLRAVLRPHLKAGK